MILILLGAPGSGKGTQAGDIGNIRYTSYINRRHIQEKYQRRYRTWPKGQRSTLTKDYWFPTKLQTG